MAIIYSDDRTLDVVPLLRPRISRVKIIEAVSALEVATKDTHFTSMNFLDDHRFYLSAEQCAVINDAVRRIHAIQLETGEIRILRQEFAPNPSMDDTYLY